MRPRAITPTTTNGIKSRLRAASAGAALLVRLLSVFTPSSSSYFAEILRARGDTLQPSLGRNAQLDETSDAVRLIPTINQLLALIPGMDTSLVRGTGADIWPSNSLDLMCEVIAAGAKAGEGPVTQSRELGAWAHERFDNLSMAASNAAARNRGSQP